MTSGAEESAARLKARIRLLEAENEILNERSEDILLLGLVAETISSLDDSDPIIETLLERVSILYEIPYCGFASLEGASPKLQHEFAQHVEKVVDSSFRLGPQALRQLEDGALSCSSDEAETLGYRPRSAENGLEALEIIATAGEKIDLVLTDVIMPKMGGSELMAALQERHPEIGVILMSGYAPKFGEATADAKNLAGWLQKPFNVNDLATTLAEAARRGTRSSNPYP